MRLEINGIEADVKQQIAITRQVADIENMTSRLVDVTNRFSMPKTNKNQQIFESGDELNTTGDRIDRLFTAKIIDQFFLFNGYGKVIEVNGDYRFQLIDLAKSLFNNMNKKIKELDFESDDFTFNSTSYGNLKLLSTSVWCFPIISMHENKSSTETKIPTSGDADLKYLRPSFRVKSILDAVFSLNNWTLTYDNDLIDQLAISSNESNFYVTSYQKTLGVTYNPVGSPISLAGLNVNDFENVVGTTSNTINIGDVTTRFRLRGTIITDATISVIFTGTDSPTGKVTTEQLTLYSGTNEVDYTTGDFSTDDATHNIAITVDGTGSIEFDDTLLYTIIEEENLGNFEDNNLIGYRVKAYDNLPDLSQIDIFRLGMILTNSMIVSDTLNKQISLATMKYSKLYNYDWSDKFIIDSENIQNELTQYGQTNYLEYDNDETVNPTLGRSSFTVNNEALEDEKSFIKLIFGASNEVEISSAIISHFNIYTNTTRADSSLNKRLIYVYNDIGDTYTLGRFLQIDWSTLKDEYYDDFVNSIYRPRYIEAMFNLNKLDVLGFNFLKTIYVDYLKSTFIVFGIEDYVDNQPTKVKMLKFR